MLTNCFCRSCLIGWISAPPLIGRCCRACLTIVAFIKAFLHFYDEWIIAAQGLRWSMTAGGGLGD